jgi:hypothetical protein
VRSGEDWAASSFCRRIFERSSDGPAEEHCEVVDSDARIVATDLDLADLPVRTEGDAPQGPRAPRGVIRALGLFWLLINETPGDLAKAP